MEKITDFDVEQYLSNTKDDTAKMILFCIELYRRRVPTVDAKALEYVYTLEHIMPKKWEKNWLDVASDDNGAILNPSSDEGKQFRDGAIQSIGNKTLLTGSLNFSIKNAAFAKKISGDGEHKPGYEAHTLLLITRDIVNQARNDTVWDEKHIASRLDSLYAEFLELWPSYLPVVNQTDDDNDANNDTNLSQYTEEELADPVNLMNAVP